MSSRWQPPFSALERLLLLGNAESLVLILTTCYIAWMFVLRSNDWRNLCFCVHTKKMFLKVMQSLY